MPPFRVSRNNEKGGANPPYPYKHSGAVMVCGSAFCLPSDLKEARKRFPFAPVIAVKGGAYCLRAFALFGLHPGRMTEMARRQSMIHSDFTTHMAGGIRDCTNLGAEKAFAPDYHWNLPAEGSSGWVARKMAAHMGFDLVVLCGIPLSKGGYVYGPSKPFQDERVISRYRDYVLQDSDYHKGVISMSGWTREVFGC